MEPVSYHPPSPAQEDAILHAPLHELAARCDEELERRDLYRAASVSALYRARWRAFGVHPERLRGRGALQQLPFVDGADLRAIARTGRTLQQALVARPRAWITSRGTSGAKKWLPLTLGDAAHWFERIQRVNRLAGEEGRSVLVLGINEPMPSPGNAVAYLWERADALAGGACLEFIIAAMEMLPRNGWHRFALQKQPEWLIGPADDALRLAEEIRRDPKLTGDAARAGLSRLRRGFFWGAPLDGPHGVRGDLAAAYGPIDLFSLYLSAECREMYVECRPGAGLHLWMDGAIHEIIPDGRAPQANEPVKTLFVDEAPPGTEGEYAVTTFGEALPLVRYRTGDRIRVVDGDGCRCGSTHPRVQFLGRMNG